VSPRAGPVTLSVADLWPSPVVWSPLPRWQFRSWLLRVDLPLPATNRPATALSAAACKVGRARRVATVALRPPSEVYVCAPVGEGRVRVFGEKGVRV